MGICIPAIATSAAFTSLIIFDLYTKSWDSLPGHAFIGLFISMCVLLICQNGSPWMAWVLLLIPVIYILFAWLWTPRITAITPITVAPPIQQCSCCRQQPCKCKKPCQKPKPVKPSCPGEPTQSFLELKINGYKYS